MKKCKTTKPKKTDSNGNLSSNDKILSTVSVKDFVNQFNDTSNENKKRRTKKKEETIQDIIDRIEEDLITIRDKAQELEDSACDHDDDEDFEDEDSEDEDEE
jgi:hypothetical protein